MEDIDCPFLDETKALDKPVSSNVPTRLIVDELGKFTLVVDGITLQESGYFSRYILLAKIHIKYDSGFGVLRAFAPKGYGQLNVSIDNH